MQEILTGKFAPLPLMLWPPKSLRIVDWNIDRGQQLQGVTDFLASANADILILQEVDVNARRTHRLNIAETIARKVKMNYVFGREFQELVQGSKDSPAYHGQATLSKWPISKPRLIRFSRQSHFWQPHWFLPKIEQLHLFVHKNRAAFAHIFAARHADDCFDIVRKIEKSFVVCRIDQDVTVA